MKSDAAIAARFERMLRLDEAIKHADNYQGTFTPRERHELGHVLRRERLREANALKNLLGSQL